jgi:hypothetical protein
MISDDPRRPGVGDDPIAAGAAVGTPSDRVAFGVRSLR